MEQENNQMGSSQEVLEEGNKEEAKRKNDAVFEMILILILGFLLGVTIKTEASKRVTIGFNDYKIQQAKQSYDFAAIKANLQQQSQEQKNDSAEDPAQATE